MNSKSSRLQSRYGSWALVTGASEGIGRAFAVELAQAGLNLLVVARREAELQVLKSELENRHAVEVQVLPADLSHSEGRAAVLAQALALDVGLVVASAGFGTSGLFIRSPLALELEMLEVNCRAVVEQCHVLGRHLAERGRGGLILFSSLVAFQGVPRSAHYAATKAYIQTLAEGLRVELKPRGVDVLAVAPGPIDSGFSRRANLKPDRAGSPMQVATESLRALGRQTTVRPGFLSKFLAYALSVPRPLRVRIMTQVMQGMTKHQP